MIPFTCNSCGRSGRAPDSAAGKIVPCPACKASMQVSDPLEGLDELVDSATENHTASVDQSLYKNPLVIIGTLAASILTGAVVYFAVFQSSATSVVPVAEIDAIEEEPAVAPAALPQVERTSKRSSPADRHEKCRLDFATMLNWGSIRTDSENDQLYGHVSGTRARFWTDRTGTKIATFTYHARDKSQSSIANGVWWLSVPCAVGGPSNEAFDENVKRIGEWMKEPTDILVLQGGFVRPEVVGGDKINLHLYFTE